MNNQPGMNKYGQLGIPGPMDGMKIFEFEDRQVRTLMDEETGNPLFCAKDVAEVLDISWDGKTLGNIQEDWKGVGNLPTPGGTQEFIFITEPAVYQLTFRSRKPQAQEFACWVFEEVLPAIRKTGGFGATTPAQMLKFMDKKIKLMSDLEKTGNPVLRAELEKYLGYVCLNLGHKLPDIDALQPAQRELLTK